MKKYRDRNCQNTKDKLIDLMHFIDHKLYFDLINKIKVDLEFSLTKKLERHISNYLRGYK